MAAPPTIHLPDAWPTQVKGGLLHATALARSGLVELWAGFENGLLVQARAAARAARLAPRLAQRSEELRILRARLRRVDPRRRPHYEPEERLAILQLRAAAGWSAVETARRFQVTANTIAAWMARLDEAGPDALLATRRPVNRFPDAVAELVLTLRRNLPAFGKVRVAELLVRAGLSLSATTVKRLQERAASAPSPEPVATEAEPE
jgi:transposase-like protein